MLVEMQRITSGNIVEVQRKKLICFHHIVFLINLALLEKFCGCIKVQ